MSFRVLVLLCLLAGTCVVGGQAQMVSPDIDRPDEPFCYFSQPTDVIGVMDGKEGTLVSPEGYFYTGWGELMFFTGNPPEAVNQRVKTLYKGYLPVNQYEFIKEGIRYAVTSFAATLDGNPESPLINFIRVRVRNTNASRREAWWSAGLRYQGIANTDWGVADNRFGRPAKAQVLGQYEQAGAEFTREWFYAFEGDALTQDSAIVYLYPNSPKPLQLMTWKTGNNEPPDISPKKLYVEPTTPVGIVQYALSLDPGQERVLEFRMPYAPMHTSSPLVSQLRSAKFDDYLQKTAAFWDGILAKGIDITVPEEKVVNTFKANLIYDLIARNKEEGWYIQKVNEFHYDAFWIRDAALILRMYDLSGYHDLARQDLEFFQRFQRPDGNFISHWRSEEAGSQYDAWGQTMWAYGEHVTMARDREFAAKIYPSVQKAVEWLKQARKNDPLHLIPVTTPGDNENIEGGHITGHNFWALIGLKNVISLAEALGKNDDARAYRAVYDDYFATFLAQLKKVASKRGGYMPPGLDGTPGQDWGNLESVYPEEILDPFDPMVTATLDSTRAKYKEGLMTYGDGRWIHHYLTIKNTETEVIRGDQQHVMEEFYALLLHTGSTHTGFEFSILPWGVRDFGMNLTPHGTFSCEFRSLLRNMLVRERGRELHLLSCVSPEWIGEGKSITVHKAATEFGTVNIDLTGGRDRATLTLNSTFVAVPSAIILHLPWFMNVKSVRVDGTPVTASRGTVSLPVGARTIEVQWSKKPNTPPMSYTRAVEDYKKEFRRRYAKFQAGE